MSRRIITEPGRRRDAERFQALCFRNTLIEEVLARVVGLRHTFWLASGCLVQSVWNASDGRPPADGIGDYDLIYGDSDLSWAAEDRTIRMVGERLADMPIRAEVRNQMRVPVWYAEKFGAVYPPLRRPEHALLRYPSRTSAIAVRRLNAGGYEWYAPFGFRAALECRIVANPRLPIRFVYDAKVAKWTARWPFLAAEPWPVSG